MEKLKFLILVFVALTIVSCYSTNESETENDCDICDVIETDFWERTSITSSITYSIAIENNGYIWAGGFDTEELNNISYLSTDNGDTWVKKNTLSSPNSIAINPINGYIFISIPGSGGLFRSTDRGENWVMVTKIVMLIHNVLITPSGEIYLGVEYAGYSFIPNPHKGVFYSSDNGETWIEKSNGLPDANVHSLALGPDGTLYAGTRNFGVYRSFDKGDTWLPPSNYNNITIWGITISDDGSIFATAMPFETGVEFETIGKPAGILKSIDKGTTWNQVNRGIPVDERVGTIMYNPINQEIFVCTGALYSPRIYKSMNFGVSWECITNGLYTYAFTFNPNTGQMFAATEYGVYRSRSYLK